ncbi:MAG TPA: hypothetical protein VGF89_05415 [Steroidobacteraceae bacterium]|jgi:hypothetical protein
MLERILRLGQLYFAIAIWRRGPQDLPAIGILLPLTIAAYVLVSVVVGVILPSMRPGWVWQVLLDTAFMALWYWLLLQSARRPERYLQTASALFGLQIIIAAPTMILVWLMERLPPDDTLRVPVFLVSLALAIWTLAAIGHILRAALERSLVFCLMLALLQMLVEELMFASIFGAGP